MVKDKEKKKAPFVGFDERNQQTGQNCSIPHSLPKTSFEASSKRGGRR